MASEADSLYRFLGPPWSGVVALRSLPASMVCWFRQRFGAPTLAQQLAWPALADGGHLLLGAPTGSGKTLAAFLPLLGSLSAATAPGTVRCVYIAPLKALVRDTCLNLCSCLDDMRPHLGADAFLPRAVARTGDSSPGSRRRLWSEPPDILLTTPETLALLLTHSRAANLFRGLRWLIVDEIHALAPSKRGADLSLSLERLTALASGSVQRIGLSATCSPRAEAAAFLAGTGRPCAIAHVPETSPLQLDIELLAEPASASLLSRLLDRLAPELDAHRTTLIFTNRRSLAERLVWALRRRFPAWAEEIAAHHSSLAAQRRQTVEQQLKTGRLRVAVNSTSLELGIDIGSVDLVVLVHPPGGAARLLQRVGRAGRAPGRPRRGLVLAARAAELLDAAVTAGSSRSAQWEALRIPSHPLDVLCQHLLGLACGDIPPTVEDAFALVRRAYPYRDLSRTDFDECLAYLAGLHRDGSPWLPARLCLEGGEFRLADNAVPQLLRRNLGTILAEETRNVVLENPETLDERNLVAVGQLDEAYADRLKPGDRFLLDGRCLEYRRTEGRAMVVEETVGRPSVPRWESNGWPLSAELARRVYLLYSQAAELLREGAETLARLLREDYGLGESATAALVELFQRQECVSEIPESGDCLVEMVPAFGGADCYVHTPLNRAANDALARVAVWRWGKKNRGAAASRVADLGFLFSTLTEVTPEAMLDLLAEPGFDADLAAAIADSETLRERFRCTAMTGLMLLRNPLGRRRRVGGRDWAKRRMFEQVRLADPDFVLLRQARREVEQEMVDAAAARNFLRELPRRTLRWRILPQPSPLAEGWTQAVAGPATMVETPAEILQRLHAEWMGE